MENAKIGMLIVSIVLNVLLFSEVRKLSSANSIFQQQVTARLDLANKTSQAGATAGLNVKDKALMEMVNASVREEIQRFAPPAPAGMNSTDKARMDQLQERVTSLQKRIDEKANAGQDKDKRLREEAAKLKQEVLALCVKR